jgi:two-component system, chemotaxis family, CheB/CheR fusion protein
MQLNENILILTEEQTIAPVKNESYFYRILMQSPFAFALLKGKEMIIAVANNSIKQVWGKGNEVEGKTLFEVLPEIVNQGFPDIINKVFTTGIPFIAAEKLVYLKRNDQLEETYFNFAYQAFWEKDETISGVVIIAYEVTVQATANKIVSDSEKKFKSMADLMPAKVSYGDLDGKTTYYNQKLTIPA